MKQEILVYQTGEYGPILITRLLNRLLHAYDLSKDVIVRYVTGSEIKAGRLFKSNCIGLAGPGRNEGEGYRQELGQSGFAAIKKASKDRKLSIIKTCAFISTGALETHWDNHFDPKNRKIVTNPEGLFQGKAVGPLNEIWQGGYISKQSDDMHCHVLPAKVLPVTYTKHLTGLHPLTGHAVYWGGCNLYPAENSNQIITSLVSCNDPYLFDPVIEFHENRGKTIASAIHPEIDADKFQRIFQTTPRAEAYPEEFKLDVANLKESDRANRAIYAHFLGNCGLPVRNSLLHKSSAPAILAP